MPSPSAGGRSGSRSVALADEIAAPWGEIVDPDLVRQALRRKRYEAVTVAHNETSTGVANPLAEIARVVREESEALLLVDAVSSLAGLALETDAWGLDFVFAGVQKGLATPPGLTVFTFSERAESQAATIPHRGYYGDLLRYRDKHREGGPITTAAVSIAWALDLQVARIAREGMAARWERHAVLQRQTADWAAARGFTFASSAGGRSATVSCLRPPSGFAARALVAALKKRGYTLGGGYGRFKESTFRIGHMGEVQTTDLAALLAAIEQETAS